MTLINSSTSTNSSLPKEPMRSQVNAWLIPRTGGAINPALIASADTKQLSPHPQTQWWAIVHMFKHRYDKIKDGCIGNTGELYQWCECLHQVHPSGTINNCYVTTKARDTSYKAGFNWRKAPHRRPIIGVHAMVDVPAAFSWCCKPARHKVH